MMETAWNSVAKNLTAWRLVWPAKKRFQFGTLQIREVQNE